MTTTQLNGKPPIAKWKVALIPLLGVVLLFVVLPKADARHASETATTAITLKASLPENSTKTPHYADLPIGTFESASMFNPFKMGQPLLLLTVGEPRPVGPTPEEIAAEKAQLEAARKKQQTALLEQINKLKVSFVIQTDRGVAAIINSKTVHIGDEIQPGVIITHIDATGLRVAVSPPETNVLSEETAPIPK